MARYLDPSSLEKHLDRLYSAALGLTGSSDAAEELVQETCVRVLAKPRRLRRAEDLPYLLGVLRNTFRDQLRTLGHRPPPEPLTDDVVATNAPSAQLPEAALEAKLVYEAIAALPEPFRDACVAVDVVELSYREAARLLQIPEGTLTSRLFRARRELVARLSGEGESSRRRPDDPHSRPRD